MEWSVWLEKSMEKLTIIALKTHTLISGYVLSKGVLCFQKKSSFENTSLRDDPRFSLPFSPVETEAVS